MIYGATPLGRDLAPRVASSMRAGMTADCTDLDIGDVTDPQEQDRPQEPAAANPPGVRRQHHRHDRQLRPVAADGHRPRGRHAAARAGSAAQGRDRRRESRARPTRDLRVRLIERHIEPRKVNLKGARVIVAGGGGVGSKDNFKLIYELAGAIGGAVGASRGRGRRRLHRQGTPDRPDRHDRPAGPVHRRAASAARSSIAPAWKSRPRSSPSTRTATPRSSRVAHYGIVGDLNQVIPMMIKAIKEKA